MLFSLIIVFYAMYRLKRALERVDAGPGGKNMVYWTSLREVKPREGFERASCFSNDFDSTRNR